MVRSMNEVTQAVAAGDAPGADRTPAGPRIFCTTRWSVVLSARGRSGGAQADEAFAELCRIYWYPLYGYVRRKQGSRQNFRDRDSRSEPY